jgi:hypothetical protein
MRRNLFWLSDEQWKRVQRHLPTDVRGVEQAAGICSKSKVQIGSDFALPEKDCYKD